MGSTKGKPTDPKLHDKITEEVKQQTNKDGEFLGSGEVPEEQRKGQMSRATPGTAVEDCLFWFHHRRFPNSSHTIPQGNFLGRPLILPVCLFEKVAERARWQPGRRVK